ncbi:hypothetical protein K402DRAFT_424468 [Aulographum hederae CBS 113979]|uniref:Uncharacterized protein n=1 Tax=Aulographum hederae CBS 113979 TaxID=1176131 RepID=A0A6G1GP55_9PEZI|nr:hypothetical protein K402DRAFT_424468 [Aulographum hederae CBS 113979]
MLRENAPGEGLDELRRMVIEAAKETRPVVKIVQMKSPDTIVEAARELEKEVREQEQEQERDQEQEQEQE